MNPWCSITLEKHKCFSVQCHPEDRGDFGHCLTLKISEYDTPLEFNTYSMTCSICILVLSNPIMKPWIKFIIMVIVITYIQSVQGHPGLLYQSTVQ